MGAFFTDARGVLQCEAFAHWPWLDHGFSTRHSAAWLEGTRLAWLKQIHSDRVLEASVAGVQGEADALVTRERGLHVGVRTADCLPVVLVDPALRVVAAIHSGWRGTAAGVSVQALQHMGEAFGSQAAGIHAAIGPGIGVCCYEVGPEVATEFGFQGRMKLDLAAAIARQLEATGVPKAQIHGARLCTNCEAELFWSYRREGEAAGRMWSGAAVAGV